MNCAVALKTLYKPLAVGVVIMLLQAQPSSHMLVYMYKQHEWLFWTRETSYVFHTYTLPYFINSRHPLPYLLKFSGNHKELISRQLGLVNIPVWLIKHWKPGLTTHCCSTQSQYHCTCHIPCLCSLSASAFIEPSLHQLDVPLEIFLWRFT